MGDALITTVLPWAIISLPILGALLILSILKNNKTNSKNHSEPQGTLPFSKIFEGSVQVIGLFLLNLCAK